MSDVLVLNADGMPLSHIPLSVVTWQTAIRLVFSEKVRVLKEYNNWYIRSQHLEIRVPSIIIMTEQVKWGKHIRYTRSNVYLRDDFTCQLQYTNRCREKAGKVKTTELTLDHVVPKSQGGKTTWINVCACCKECNSSKGNDHTVIPKKKPHKPSYYEILSKRKNLPIHIRDEDWKFYLDWPEDLINVIPKSKEID